MKFSDGVWRTANGLKVASPHHVFGVRTTATEVLIDASSCPFRSRFEDQETVYLTIRLSSPAPNVIGVSVEHFSGVPTRGPAFELFPDFEVTPIVVDQEDFVSLSSGDLTIRVEKRDDWRLDVLRAGKRITGGALGAGGYAVSAEDRKAYVFERLDLGVGELVYGFGERFTAFTRNGQTVEIWNRDGGTSTEQAYKNIPFFLTNRGWGVLVNQPDRVSFEVGSEFVSKVGFSVEGELLSYLLIDGPTPKDVLDRYTRLTGRPALPPAWSFGLWLTTSFTTEYDEKTVNGFVDGMRQRDVPLHVFHFDCFWMRAQHWCDFEWDPVAFPDPEAMLARLKAKGLHVCVWINPYIAQRSRLFDEGKAKGYLLKRPDGAVWQWDHWQSGMGFVDFTNPDACAWYAGHLERLVKQGVDCFKTDFGERIPTDVVYFDGSDPNKMHNYYTFLYNRLVFELLAASQGRARSRRLRSIGHRWRTAFPCALGRRQRRELRIDGRKPARRAFARSQRFRLLEPRHRRLSEHRAGAHLQALVRLRLDVESQPAARLHLLSRAVDLRRRGRRRAASLYEAQVPADALPLRGRNAGFGARIADDAGDASRIPG